MSDKKQYIASIHSFGGSMWEATGDHFVVELTDEQYLELCEMTGEFPNSRERGFLIEPVPETIGYQELLDILYDEGWSDGEEED